VSGAFPSFGRSFRVEETSPNIGKKTLYLSPEGK
jgi:hypothetical protein